MVDCFLKNRSNFVLDVTLQSLHLQKCEDCVRHLTTELGEITSQIVGYWRNRSKLIELWIKPGRGAQRVVPQLFLPHLYRASTLVLRLYSAAQYKI